jgi:hypothetical protein
MSGSDKPTLTVVAGREGPTEGPSSNAARIAVVKAKMQDIPKRKRGRPRKNSPVENVVPKTADANLTKERADAYFDMEPHLCDCVKMGRIAVQLFDDPNRELYDFAVHQAWMMLEELRERYYAKGWR